jgi:lysyl-tRNA synthetase class 2
MGRLHNPEFTMLEWYRLGFDHHKLMDEVEELIILLLKTKTAARYTYEEVYKKFVDLNPHKASLEELKFTAQKNKLTVAGLEDDRDTWVQLLFAMLVEPNLEQDCPVFIYDFPQSQAMLARISSNKPAVAARFELYYRGIELANGFHELNNSEEQLKRFNNDLARRKALGMPPVNIDHQFIGLLSQLPDCSGVALGVDRLILLSGNCQSLDELIPRGLMH